MDFDVTPVSMNAWSCFIAWYPLTVFSNKARIWLWSTCWPYLDNVDLISIISLTWCWPWCLNDLSRRGEVVTKGIMWWRQWLEVNVRRYLESRDQASCQKFVTSNCSLHFLVNITVMTSTQEPSAHLAISKWCKISGSSQSPRPVTDLHDDPDF